MFKSFWGSQEQQARPHIQENPAQSSWYPPSVTSINSSRPSTPGSSSSGVNVQRASDHLHASHHGQVSPSEAAGIIYQLKDKSVDEFRKLLSDKDAYNQFLLSMDQVKIQNNLRDELRKETLQLAKENLEKEPRILELRNQCMIIRTTELAAAQEKLNDTQRQKDEVLKFYSPSTHVQRLQDSMNEIEEECDALANQLLEKELDLNVFVQKHKKLRTKYHRSIGRHTNGMAELWALRYGLGYMHFNGLERLIVESDSYFVIGLFCSKFNVAWQFCSLYQNRVTFLRGKHDMFVNIVKTM